MTNNRVLAIGRVASKPGLTHGRVVNNFGQSNGRQPVYGKNFILGSNIPTFTITNGIAPTLTVGNWSFGDASGSSTQSILSTANNALAPDGTLTATLLAEQPALTYPFKFNVTNGSPNVTLSATAVELSINDTITFNAGAGAQDGYGYAISSSSGTSLTLTTNFLGTTNASCTATLNRSYLSGTFSITNGLPIVSTTVDLTTATGNGSLQPGSLITFFNSAGAPQAQAIVSTLTSTQITLTTNYSGTTNPSALAAPNIIGAQGRLNLGASPFTLSSKIYTVSCYAKAGTYNFFGIRVAVGTQVIWNLTTGAPTIVNSAGLISTGQQYVGNGWWRIWYTTNLSATSFGGIYIFTNTTSVQYSYLPATVGTVYFWGAQTVDGNQPLPYIPTVGTAITTKSTGAIASKGGRLITLSGTVSSISSATVTGNATLFTKQLVVNALITFSADVTRTRYQVQSITNDTTLVLTTNYTGATATGATMQTNNAYI